MLMFTGCEKVIDLELDNAKPLVVIDAGVSDQVENQIVRVSRTYSFTEPNKFNGVEGAKVVLTGAGSNPITYTEISPGVYRSTRFRGRPGINYTLNVTVDDVTYTASSIMPAKVVLDSLSFRDFSFFGETNTYVAANFIDPKGIQNQYRYIMKLKDKLEEDEVSDDRFNDGNNVSNVIFFELGDLVAGDVVEVEFQCIDRNVYTYFYSLNRNSGGGGPPVAPSNPPSNFNNGALGIFSAYTSNKRMAVIQ